MSVSIRDDLLGYSDPRFLKSLRRGVRLAICGILISTIAAAADLAFLVALMVSGVGFPDLTAMLVVAAMSVAGATLYVIGAWFLTKPDPSGLGEVRYGVARILTRYMVAAVILNPVLSLCYATGIIMSLNLTAQIASYSDAVACVVAMIAQLQYLEKLCKRLPDDSLSARFRFVKWGLAVSSGTGVLWSIVETLLSPMGFFSVGDWTTLLITVVAGLAAMFFVILFMFRLHGLSLALVMQTELARINWVSFPDK